MLNWLCLQSPAVAGNKHANNNDNNSMQAVAEQKKYKNAVASLFTCTIVTVCVCVCWSVYGCMSKWARLGLTPHCIFIMLWPSIAIKIRPKPDRRSAPLLAIEVVRVKRAANMFCKRFSSCATVEHCAYVCVCGCKPLSICTFVASWAANALWIHTRFVAVRATFSCGVWLLLRFYRTCEFISSFNLFFYLVFIYIFSAWRFSGLIDCVANKKLLKRQIKMLQKHEKLQATSTRSLCCSRTQQQQMDLDTRTYAGGFARCSSSSCRSGGVNNICRYYCFGFCSL